MTMTPLATIADALIDFILSLLRDPAAAEEFEEDPEGSMDRAGLGACSVADVRSVAPVIYDNPAVVVRPPQTYVPSNQGTGGQSSTPVERAIQNIVNNFAYDNRATVVDQSVNQNIWAKGDVNQIFDQEAIINTGDHGVTAGGDADVDNSSTDIGGDLNVGNTTTDTTVTDSFNDNSTETTTDTDTTVTDSYNETTTTTTDETATDSHNVVTDGSDQSIDGSFNETTDNSDSSDNSVNGSYNDASVNQVSVEDSSGDVSVMSVDSAPEDPFVDDQP